VGETEFAKELAVRENFHLLVHALHVLCRAWLLESEAQSRGRLDEEIAIAVLAVVDDEAVVRSYSSSLLRGTWSVRFFSMRFLSQGRCAIIDELAHWMSR